MGILLGKKLATWSVNREGRVPQTKLNEYLNTTFKNVKNYHFYKILSPRQWLGQLQQQKTQNVTIVDKVTFVGFSALAVLLALFVLFVAFVFVAFEFFC